MDLLENKLTFSLEKVRSPIFSALAGQWIHTQNFLICRIKKDVDLEFNKSEIAQIFRIGKSRDWHSEFLNRWIKKHT